MDTGKAGRGDQPGIQNLRMDVKDMLNYRKVLESKRTEAFDRGDTEKYARLSKQCDVMDMVFDTIYVATIEDQLPTFKALLGSDFDISSLKLALPEYKSAEIVDDTQVEIEFVDEKPVVEEVKTGKPKAKAKEIPEPQNYMDQIERLMSKNIADNILPAIKLYLENTGKELLPSDAYKEIKELLPNCRIPRVYDASLAYDFLHNGPLSVFSYVKKHMPELSETEVGRLVEMAVLNTITNEETPFTKAKELEDFLKSGFSRKQIKLWKEDPKKDEVVNLYVQKLSAESLSTLKLSQEEWYDKQVGRIIAAMSPSLRNGMEKKNGRKPYVENGYPC
jgi:hypothetical protein